MAKLKAEIIKDLEDLQQKHQKFKDDIHQFIADIYDDSCYDTLEIIDEFYEHVGLDKPTKIVTIEMSAFVDEFNLQIIDSSGYEVKYDIKLK
jgi:hypothetical protein